MNASNVDSDPPDDPPPETAHPLRDFPGTILLIVACVGVYVLMVANGVSAMDPPIQSLIKWGANFGPLTMNGQLWRLLSSVFIHIGVFHILMNMYVLYSVGPSLENVYGTPRYLLLYFLSGLGGSIASVCWNPKLVSAGASGAIFGIVGGLLGFFLKYRGRILADLFRQQMRSLLAFVGYNLVIGFVIPFVDNSAHIGGLVTGFALGLVIVPRGGVRLGEIACVTAVIAMLAGGVYLGHLKAGTPELRALAQTTLTESMKIESSELRYSESLPSEKVARYADEMRKLGYTKNRSTLLLLDKGDRIEAGFVVKDNAWSSEDIASEFRRYGTLLSKKVFDGKPVDVELYDKNLSPMRLLKDPK